MHRAEPQVPRARSQGGTSSRQVSSWEGALWGAPGSWPSSESSQVSFCVVATHATAHTGTLRTHRDPSACPREPPGLSAASGPLPRAQPARFDAEEPAAPDYKMAL